MKNPTHPEAILLVIAKRRAAKEAMFAFLKHEGCWTNQAGPPYESVLSYWSNMIAALELLVKVLADDWKNGGTQYGHDVGRMYQVIFGRPHHDAQFMGALKDAIKDQKFLFEPDPGILNRIPELEQLWDELAAAFYGQQQIYDCFVDKEVKIDQRCVQFFLDNIARFIPAGEYSLTQMTKEKILQSMRFQHDRLSERIARLEECQLGEEEFASRRWERHLAEAQQEIQSIQFGLHAKYIEDKWQMTLRVGGFGSVSQDFLG